MYYERGISNKYDVKTEHEDEVTTMKVNELKDSLIGVDMLSKKGKQSHCWVKCSLAL